ncbi:MAG: LD-carboxypeptidase [Streptosporangiales bacterium]|nr:LD-carboxypeptidase [Streptosporangiales bacterium]
MPAGGRTRPPRLRPGDRVAVVAPGGPVDPVRLDAGCAVLRGFGLDITTGPHVRDRTGFLAGRDADRAADLQAAWCDPSVRAVVCARGGYGSMRLLDRLDWDALAAAGAKLLHGASDVTALHVAFGARLGLATTFGPMAALAPIGSAEPEPGSLACLRDTLFAPGRTQVLAAPTPRALAGGRAFGLLDGGNLSLLASLAGTPYAPPAAPGRIVLLEDINEEPYRVDRMITQLLLAGWFDGVTGVILGSWVGCGSPEEVEEVLAERLLQLNVPVLAGLPIGHGVPQLTLPLGVAAELDADAGTIALHEPALS